MAEQSLTEFPISRLESESPKAWAAFKHYCELGDGRSLSGLTAFFKSTETPQKPPTQSKDTLKGWSTKFDWAQRASEYDAIKESRRLQRLQAEEEARWREEVENYRERNRRVGAASFELAIAQLHKCTEAIRDSELTTDQAIRAMSGIARLIEIAQSSEGTALGVNQLMKELDL